MTEESKLMFGASIVLIAVFPNLRARHQKLDLETQSKSQFVIDNQPGN